MNEKQIIKEKNIIDMIHPTKGNVVLEYDRRRSYVVVAKGKEVPNTINIGDTVILFCHGGKDNHPPTMTAMFYLNDRQFTTVPQQNIATVISASETIKVSNY